MRSELPRRGLVVREPYASWIVDGRKTWELRRWPTHVRGRIGIVSGGQLLGDVELVGVEGPFALEELGAFRHLHHGAEEFLRAYAGGRPLWAWVLRGARRYPEPLAVPPHPGRRLWVDLSGLVDQTEP